MAWLPITNHTSWEYDTAPADPGAGHPQRPLWLKQSGGIRTENRGQSTASFTDLTYTAAAGTIETAAGDFTKSFRPGMDLYIKGSASNDGQYVIQTVTATTIGVVGTLTADEGTGDAPGTLLGIAKVEIYVKCRPVGSTKETHGEINKTYWDNQ